MEEILTASYSVGGIISALFHLPQLLRLWREPESVKGIAVASWLGWFVLSCNAIAYAYVVNGDWIFLALCLLNTVCQVLVLAFVARAKLILRRSAKPAAKPAAIPAVVAVEHEPLRLAA